MCPSPAPRAQVSAIHWPTHSHAGFSVGVPASTRRGVMRRPEDAPRAVSRPVVHCGDVTSTHSSLMPRRQIFALGPLVVSTMLAVSGCGPTVIGPGDLPPVATGTGSGSAPSVATTVVVGLSGPLALTAPFDTVFSHKAQVRVTVLDQGGAVMSVPVQSITSSDTGLVQIAGDSAVVRDTGTVRLSVVTMSTSVSPSRTGVLNVTVLRPMYLVTHPSGVCYRLSATTPATVVAAITTDYRDGRYRLFPDVPTGLTYRSENPAIAMVSSTGIVTAPGSAGMTWIRVWDSAGRSYGTQIIMDPAIGSAQMTCVGATLSVAPVANGAASRVWDNSGARSDARAPAPNVR